MAASGDDQPPVRADLFDLVSQQAEQIANGKLKGDTYVQGTPIVLFCENFYDNFFAHVIRHQIKGINQEAKTAAARQRLLLGDTQPEQRLLLAKFEALCDLWNGALGFGYDSSTEDLHRFIQQWVPAFLDAVSAWAATLSDATVRAAAERARAGYMAALSGYRT